MKLIRQYKPVGRDPKYYASCRQKTVYKLSSYEKDYLWACWDARNLDEFEQGCRDTFGAYDRYSRFDGDYFESFEFYFTKHRYLTVVREWGYDV